MSSQAKRLEQTALIFRWSCSRSISSDGWMSWKWSDGREVRRPRVETCLRLQVADSSAALCHASRHPSPITAHAGFRLSFIFQSANWWKLYAHSAETTACIEMGWHKIWSKILQLFEDPRGSSEPPRVVDSDVTAPGSSSESRPPASSSAQCHTHISLALLSCSTSHTRPDLS